MEGLRDTWTLLDSSGKQLLEFTSYLEDDAKSGGNVVEEPIEQGSFTSYNKVPEPIDIYVKLAKQGTSDELQSIIDKLENLRANPILFSIVTPDTEYRNMTLESYSRTRKLADGSGMLVVELHCVEVKQVSSVASVSTAGGSSGSGKSLKKSQCKNPSNVSKEKTGKTNTKEVDPSIMYKWLDE